MKNLIVTIGIIFLLVMFISYQKDANSLALSNGKLQDIAKDSARYLVECVQKEGNKIKNDEELQVNLQKFLMANGYDDKVVDSDIKWDKEKKTIAVKLDVGRRKYNMDFLNNENSITKEAEVAY